MVYQPSSTHTSPGSTFPNSPVDIKPDVEELKRTLHNKNSPQDPSSSSPSSVGRTRRRQMAGKSIEEELCLICGDRASGYHYNALSCEGCKGFFRRSITRGATYKCKDGGNCEMDMWMRRRCQHCRLNRCYEVGMKAECLLSEEQCKARDMRRKARMTIHQDQASPPQPSPDSNSLSSQRPSPQSCQPTVIESNEAACKGEGATGSKEDHSLILSPDEKHLLELCVINQDRFELPSQGDLEKLSPSNNESSRTNDMHLMPEKDSKPKEMVEMIYKQMAEITVVITQLIVEFAKQLWGFSTISKEDQIVLLKGSASEVMMLRTARRYDLETDSIVFANGMPYTRNNLRFAGLYNYVDMMYNFCRAMSLLEVDNAEYALLTAICIFSDRPSLVEVKKVERIQEKYVEVLNKYCHSKRKKGSNGFAKVLMKLTDLRSLSEEHSQVLLALKVEKGNLPPLLEEYFDVGDAK